MLVSRTACSLTSVEVPQPFEQITALDHRGIWNPKFNGHLFECHALALEDDHLSPLELGVLAILPHLVLDNLGWSDSGRLDVILDEILHRQILRHVLLKKSSQLC